MRWVIQDFNYIVGKNIVVIWEVKIEKSGTSQVLPVRVTKSGVVGATADRNIGFPLHKIWV